jgi:DNA repair exonuclease SbcCD ATPase subunit
MKYLTVLSLIILIAGCSGNVGSMDRREMSSSLMQRADMRVKEGKISEAVDIYKEILAGDPAVARAHLNLALVLHENPENIKKDYFRAVYHYNRYLELRPKTEKKDMIEERIRLVEQSFAAIVLKRELRENAVDTGSDTGYDEYISRITGLETQISELRRKNSEQKQEINRLAQGLGDQEYLLSEMDKQKAEIQKHKTELQKYKTELQKYKAEIQKYTAEIRRLKNQLADKDKQIADIRKNSGNLILESRFGRVYTVQKNDNLQGIAQKYYEDKMKWKDIWNANRDKIKDPDRLKEGQVIVIP